MHASRVSSAMAVASALFNVVAAGPVIPKAIIQLDLNPWVSMDASDLPVATITPVLTTVSGTPTIIGAAPTSLTATATTTSTPADSKPTDTSVSTGGGSYEVCNNLDGEYAPFCKPDNGSAVWVDNKYYVTWDTTFFTGANTTFDLVANYVNISKGSGPIAFTFPAIRAQQGYFAWTIDKAWMNGLSSNNITLYINPTAPVIGKQSFQGPTVMITTKPSTYYQQPHTKAPEGQSLYIALPTVFGFILVCVCGGFIFNRKQRKIEIGNIMGRRKGYGVGKSRAQRMGLGKKKAGAIALRNQELAAEGQYRDKPEARVSEREKRDGRARADSDALGSLAGSLPEDRYLED